MHVSWSRYPCGTRHMSIWRSGLQTLTDCAVQSFQGQMPITQIFYSDSAVQSFQGQMSITQFFYSVRFDFPSSREIP